MSRKNKLAVLALACAALLSAPAGATEIKEVTSPGGIKAWLVEEHALPLVAVKIGFRDSGFASDTESTQGRANMTAAMLTEGAGDLDSREFNKALEEKAIRLNMGVDEDMFTISMNTLSEYKDEAFSDLGMAMTKPRFDDEAMERTRRQTLTLITQQEQEPGYLLNLAWQQVAYGKHPYSNPQLGTKETVDRLSKSDLEHVMGHYLTKENILISVVGDISEAELGALLDKYLGKLPQHFDPDAKIPDIQLGDNSQPVLIDFDIPQTMVMFGAQGVKRDDPDYYNAYVMNQILGGGGSLSALLAIEIREKRGLAYSVATYLNPLAHAAGWQGEFATRDEKVGDAVGVLRNTLNGFAANGPSDKQLADAKTYLTGSFVLHLDSNESIAEFLLSMQFNHLGRDYLDQRNHLIEMVTKADVARVAKRLIDTDKMLMVMVGKPVLKESQ